MNLVFEIWFFDLAIMRRLNHAFDFAPFAKFFFLCIFTLFVAFRDTTYVHEFDDDAFFDVLWSLYCLEINEIIDVEFEFFEIWSFIVFARGWITLINWFNFLFTCDWILFIFSSMIFSMRASISDDFIFFTSCVAFTLCEICAFCTLYALCVESAFCIFRFTFSILFSFEFEFKFIKLLQWFNSFKNFRLDAFWFDFAKFTA